jgi:hypothetical protein
MGTKSSARLVVGQTYSRERLRDMFGIRDATLNNGIFKPAGHDSVWLFVTANKTSDRTQYRDSLNGDDLYFEGQTKGRTDSLISRHREQGDELLLFFRESKSERPDFSFRYEGSFEFADSKTGPPTRFHLRRSGARGESAGTIAPAAERPASASPSQGFGLSPTERRVVERHAQSLAERHYAGLGYEVRDVSATQCYDLSCVTSRNELRVEVKGTTGSGEAVILTRNEVEHAREFGPRMALFIVSRIQLSERDGMVTASGGEVRVIEPWDVAVGVLEPIQYQYTPPRR